MNERAIDVHSVTCPICGELADERDAVTLTDDIEEIGPALVVEDPIRVGAIVSAVHEFGRGEAHRDCFQTYMDEYTQEHTP